MLSKCKSYLCLWVCLCVCTLAEGWKKGLGFHGIHTQGESGGKVNIFEAIVSVVVRKKVRMDVCVILNVAEIELCEFLNTKAL